MNVLGAINKGKLRLGQRGLAVQAISSVDSLAEKFAAVISGQELKTFTGGRVCQKTADPPPCG